MEIEINAVGVSFKNEDGTKRQEILADLYDNVFTEGFEDTIKVGLKREPKNKHDPNAVAIMITDAEGWDKRATRVGYVPRHQAAWLSQCLKDKEVKRCRFKSMGLTKRGKIGITIDVVVKKKKSPRKKLRDEQGREFEIFE